MPLRPGEREPHHRVDQRCDSCMQYDRHPRHVNVGPDGAVVYKHMDCCHNDGCPDTSCTNVLHMSGRAWGLDLVNWIATNIKP